MMRRNRAAFTLLELMLSLSLIVVATALIGNLMHIYSRNFATRGEDIRRMQLAKSILNSIAEDLRAVVLKQPYDASVLSQQLGGGGGGGAVGGTGGSASAGGAGATAGGNAGGQTGGGMSQTGMGQTGSTSGNSSSMGGSTAGSSTTNASAGGTSGTDAASMTSTVREPGIYGNQYEIMLDVSRIPRTDEYIPAPSSLVSPTLTDVPGDIKTVSYSVQTSSTMGVEDSMNAFNDPTQSASGNGGLIRRQLDRTIMAYANEVSDTRLQRTGDLIAPEVVALEFAYYDGVQWVYEWDSSTQALPWLVQITLAIQSATGEERASLQPGVSLSTLTFDQQSQYGIQIYELVVAIPGAQLRAASAQTTATDDGMSSMGL
jgi:hypothetical protein